MIKISKSQVYKLDEVECYKSIKCFHLIKTYVFCRYCGKIVKSSIVEDISKHRRHIFVAMRLKTS